METGPRTRTLYQLHEPSPLTERARLWWFVGGGLYVATLLWTLPRVAEPLQPLPAIPLAHALSLAVVSSVTAVVLWVEARRNQVRGYALLAAVFSSVSILLLAFALAFPGALMPPDAGGRPQPVLGGGSTAVALFMLWHIVITVGIPAAAVLLAVDEKNAREPGLPHGVTPWVLGAMIPTLAVCVWWLGDPDLIPPLISGGLSLTALGTVVVLATCAVAVIGLVVAVVVTRGRSSLSRWLIAVCVLNLGDAILNLGAQRYSVGWYVARGLGFLTLSALLVLLVIELGRIDRRTDVAATTDQLTGLRNRMGLLDEIDREMARAQRDQRRLAVLALDLDGFKSVNDAYGHPAGDALLVEMSKRLRKLVRGGDLLVRMGGDEFVVILVGLESARVAITAADRIVSELGKPVDLDGRTVDVTVSLGLTVFPGAAETADDLLRHADRAMYEAKAAGGDTVRMFAPQR